MIGRYIHISCKYMTRSKNRIKSVDTMFKKNKEPNFLTIFNFPLGGIV